MQISIHESENKHCSVDTPALSMLNDRKYVSTWPITFKQMCEEWRQESIFFDTVQIGVMKPMKKCWNIVDLLLLRHCIHCIQ